MLFMTIERFRDRDARPVLGPAKPDPWGGLPPLPRARPHAAGRAHLCRQLVEANLDRCFQLMECDDARLLQQWASHWHGLIDFEFIPVVPGKDTATAMERLL